LNVNTLDEARSLIASLPLAVAGLMECDFIELGAVAAASSFGDGNAKVVAWDNQLRRSVQFTDSGSPERGLG